MAAESSDESPAQGVFYAIIAVGFAFVAALNFRTAEYGAATMLVAIAVGNVVFALDHLRWRSKRPWLANAALVPSSPCS